MGCKKTGVFTAKCVVIGHYGGSFSVSLYNNRKELICRKDTDKDGSASFIVPCTDEYSVCVTAYDLSPRGICSRVHLCEGKSLLKYFVFTFPPTPVKVNFTLKDAFYSGLPISQGVVNLWQK